ncbi:MAG: hypothetical protein DMG03_00625 [Acidobacteria bacterium]|nr:MAG: hypothetical protein DMG03_00625 [Acidobacteriota bacterium]
MKRLFVAAASLLFVPQQPPTSQRLAIEQLIDIRHPSSPSWSPDGAHLAYLSERGGFFWSADGSRVYFPRAGDLWQAPIAGGSPTAVWTTKDAETNITPSADRSSVAFARSRELIVRSLVDGKETVWVRLPEGIGAISWAPDGKHIVFDAGAKTIRHEQTPDYSGAKITYTIFERRRGETWQVPGDSQPVRIARTALGNLRWIDAAHWVSERVSDFKDREIIIGGLTPESGRPVYEERDEKFWSIPGQAEPNALPSPDGKWIAFISDRDGWDHLYVMPSDGARRLQPSEAIQITKGKFEAWRPAWSRDSTRIAFDANEPDRPGDRHIGVATINNDPSHPSVMRITSGRGTDTSPVWAPDGTKIVYQHTDAHNSADLFIVDVAARTSVRLSDSMPASIDRAAFVEPQFVHYPGPDGQQVPGWLFVPKNLDRTRKHPAIVWIHGDGVNQAKLRRLLQLSPVSAAAGLCRFRSGLSRQHRLRTRLAHRRVHGRGRERRERCVVGRELLKDAALCRCEPHGRVGTKLRRLFHAHRHDRSADAFPRRRRRRGRRRLRDVLRGSVPRRLDGEPHRHAGAESKGVRAGVAAVSRGPSRAAAAGAPWHLGRQRSVPPLRAADR